MVTWIFWCAATYSQTTACVNYVSPARLSRAEMLRAGAEGTEGLQDQVREATMTISVTTASDIPALPLI